MKSAEKFILCGFAALVLFISGGCATISGVFASNDPVEPESIIVRRSGESIYISDYTPDSLLNYQLGRGYAAAGRYELAREHYLLALAAANGPGLQEALAGELRSVDLIIKSLR